MRLLGTSCPIFSGVGIDLRRPLEETAMTENGAPGKGVSLDRHQLPIKLTIAVDNGKERAAPHVVVACGS
jgi:hypothetical protein